MTTQSTNGDTEGPRKQGDITAPGEAVSVASVPPLEHDLFLLMLNLSQVEDEQRIKTIFLEAINALWSGVKFQYAPADEEPRPSEFPIATFHNRFGAVRLAETSQPLSDETLNLLRNALCMLAIVLENRRQAQLLSGENARLETLVAERTRDYAAANSRLAAEIEERRQAEATLGVALRKYRTLFESFPLGITVSDPTGKIIEVNPAAERILGLPKEEHLQRHIGTDEWSIVRPDGSPMPLEEYASVRALKEGRVIGNVEMGVRRPDGDTAWLNVTAAPLDMDDYGAVITYSDTTEYKRVQLALQENKATLQSFYEAVPAGIIIQGADGEILFTNRLGAEILGLNVGEVEGRTSVDPIWHMVDENGTPIPGDEHPSMITLRTGQPLRNAVRGLSVGSSQDRRWLLINTEPVFAKPGGSATRVLIFFLDITDRKQAEEQKRREQHILETRLALLEHAHGHSLDEFMQAILDEAERLTDSGIGFMHFLEDDQETLVLQTWSTNTLRHMCKAEGKGSHYPVSEAGVWVDCIRERRPVIHNDYASLPHRRGLPDGHAPVTRELVVPLVLGDRIAVIMGVGNKPVDYNDADVQVLQRFLQDLWEAVLRKRAEEALLQSKEQYKNLVEANFDWVWETDREGLYTYSSPMVTRLLGYAPEDVVGKPCWAMTDDDEAARVRAAFVAHAAVPEPLVAFQHINRDRDGREVLLETSAVPVLGPDGAFMGYRGVDRNLTERRQLEEQLRQSQKLEAVGQLAGGVAHDFNNLLQIIMGSIESALADLEANHSAREFLTEVVGASERARDLVAQLLAFSRKQLLRPVVLDLNALVLRFLKMIRRIIGEHIRLKFVPGDQVGPVCGDPVMLEQVLMNLCLNARDAMDRSGTLTIETADATPGKAFRDANPWATAERYVSLRVADTGKGIDPAHLPHIFEPFFTTKDKSKGCGLGLATAYGIVRQHGGMIDVTSEKTVGTTVTVYLPAGRRSGTGPEQASRGLTAAGAAGGTETILLAEDDENVRNMTVRTLTRNGYTVLAAVNGAAAVALYNAHPDQVDMLLLDVVMPELGGREAYEHIRALRPDIPVLFISGYNEATVSSGLFLEAGIDLLPKPYRSQELLARVRKTLDSGRT